MPKKKSKNKMKGGGESGVGCNAEIAGPSNSVDFEAIGKGLENLSFMDPDEDMVEVVYVEPSLKRTKWVHFSAPISQDWLRRCVTNSHGAWSGQLLGVQPAHLTGRFIPQATQSFFDVAVGKGLVVVELEKAHTDNGLVGGGSLAAATALTIEEANREMEQRLVEMERRFDTKLTTKRETFRDLHCFTKEEQRHKIESLKVHIERLNGQI